MVTLPTLLRAYDWVPCLLTFMRAFERQLFALMGFEKYCNVGGFGSVRIRNN